MPSATTEQSLGIEELNRAMTQLEQITQQNATLTPRDRIDRQELVFAHQLR